MGFRLTFAKALSGLCLFGCLSQALNAQDATTAVSVDNIGRVDADDRLLNDLFMNQWLRVDETGKISGQIRKLGLTSNAGLPLDAMRVALVRKGFRSEVITNSSGRFSFIVPSPGRYSLVVSGTDSYAIVAVHVLEHGRATHLPSEIEVPVHQGWNGEIDRRVQSLLTPGGFWDEDQMVDPRADNRVSNPALSVRSDANGNLIGSLRASVPNSTDFDYSSTHIFISQNGVEVTKGKANPDGSFSIPGLASGSYGFVAVGPRGISVFGFSFESAGQMMNQTQLNPSQRGYVATNAAQGNSSLNVELSPPIDNSVPPLPPTDEVVSDEFIPMDDGFGGYGGFGGGGFGGGLGGGGGGGGGGFGGLGGAGLLGAAGLIGAAINDNNPVLPALSPIN